MPPRVQFANSDDTVLLFDPQKTPVRTKPPLSPLNTNIPSTPTGPVAAGVITPPYTPISPTSPTTPATPTSKRARKSRSRARRNEPVEPPKKRIQNYGFKKYWVDENGNKICEVGEDEKKEGSPPPPLSRPPETHKMTVRAYGEKVADLGRWHANARRKDGKGTYQDPEIIWLVDAPKRIPGRTEGILKVCREASQIMKVKSLWIRSHDHSTTRTITRTYTGNRIGNRDEFTIDVAYHSDWPHITVYMGASCEYEYEGHLYCEYETELPRVPKCLGRPDITRSHPDWKVQVLELYDRKFLRDRAQLAGALG